MSYDPASHDAFKWQCRRRHVESLRIPWEGMGAMANTERNIAALMIENLMEEVEAFRQAMQKADRDIMQLRQQVTDLLGERDEARREVCSMNETGLRMNESDKKREAKRRNWDCFKEKP